ncbi:hypothetical protein SDC9_156472 [bioreactor metagenome]|uniref:DUF7507 domain-containing protein n=1 Tax=bioreactor metagenome TaxID=1076179 RepID=A0A645F9D3_9ZZZZ
MKISKAAGAPADANRSTIVGGAGDTVHYGFTVTNTGRSTLTNVAVSDPLVGAIPDTSYVWPDSSQPGVLLAGQTATVMALYTITATATGATPNSQRVTSMTTASAANVAGVVVPEANASRETAVQAPAPRLSIVKTASVADTNKSKVSGDAGDVISYQIKVANAGNVSVSGVTIADPLPGLSALSIQWPNAAAPGTLAVGEAAIATATYTITAADVKVGKVSNTATASVPGGLLTPDSVTEPVDSVSGTADTVIAHVPTDTVVDAASIPTLGIGR